ncbi:uncharacterized protein LAESUDRAFT_717163 [Laetiporus sulphureus 93-53]|uniref:DUF6534 domain-containing protein n=1 Tax=Laetiporus sulphureus 93-53 TaxID=1314785 RepID=A0A165C0N4_9APHY|nr:uncharacterized protein LAESUDRAFT_717163 [Laetiporus sulphureus 93-53]KZT01987.1 hypothetical protein LAESUDRAFT_717163 [Laetiporus sulphureus 93-53]
MSTIIEKFVGPFLITICVTMILSLGELQQSIFRFYGMSTIQAYVYWWNYPDNSLKIKMAVAAICYLIVDFGDLAKVERIFWSGTLAVLITVVIAAIVQGFFIHRLWILRAKNRFLTSIALLMQCNAYQITLTSGVSLATTEDITITVSLIYYLQKSRDGTCRTLQTYTVNAGGLTMLTSIVIRMTFVFYKHSLIFLGIVSIQEKLYANSFLAILNARQHLKNPRGTAADDSYQTVMKATRNNVAEAGVVDLNSTYMPTNSNIHVENGDVHKVQMLA